MQSEMQVLIVEDSAVYRKLISDNLKAWGFRVTVAENGAQASAVLERPDSPKLVLLDWVLPDIEGIELCQQIREAGPSRPYVYVILLTSKEGRQNMLEAMQAGADDYLVKPFDESELKARLMVGKRILNLQDELVEAREAMRHAATHDSLTELLNRGEILDMLQRELERARRERKPLTVILADIDHFKQVNDTLGHLFGDQALQEIARRLRSSLRVYDWIGRYGGEEFLLVLPGCDLEDGMARSNELRELVAGTPVVALDAQKDITVSMGVAVSECVGKGEVEALLSRADGALYAAKGQGRNRVAHCASAPKKRGASQASQK
ncbi:MAG: diguanylate cyclase [Acidobacteriia bacterium]|nr:diguanylate cyclase [Terriglobia bacterium]